MHADHAPHTTYHTPLPYSSIARLLSSFNLLFPSTTSPLLVLSTSPPTVVTAARFISRPIVAARLTSVSVSVPCALGLRFPHPASARPARHLASVGSPHSVRPVWFAAPVFGRHTTATEQGIFCSLIFASTVSRLAVYISCANCPLHAACTSSQPLLHTLPCHSKRSCATQSATALLHTAWLTKATCLRVQTPLYLPFCLGMCPAHLSDGCRLFANTRTQIFSAVGYGFYFSAT